MKYKEKIKSVISKSKKTNLNKTKRNVAPTSKRKCKRLSRLEHNSGISPGKKHELLKQFEKIKEKNLQKIKNVLVQHEN